MEPSQRTSYPPRIRLANPEDAKKLEMKVELLPFPKPPKKPPRRLWLWLAPLACLLCPAHLLGFLASFLGLYKVGHDVHVWGTFHWGDLAFLALVLPLAWWLERRHHRKHGCDKHQH